MCVHILLCVWCVVCVFVGVVFGHCVCVCICVCVCVVHTPAWPTREAPGEGQVAVPPQLADRGRRVTGLGPQLSPLLLGGGRCAELPAGLCRKGEWEGRSGLSKGARLDAVVGSGTRGAARCVGVTHRGRPSPYPLLQLWVPRVPPTGRPVCVSSRAKARLQPGLGGWWLQGLMPLPVRSPGHRCPQGQGSPHLGLQEFSLRTGWAPLAPRMGWVHVPPDVLFLTPESQAGLAGRFPHLHSRWE